MSDTTFDLGTFSQVPLTVVDKDAAGDVVPGVSAVLTSSDPTVLTLQDQADGTTLALRATKNAGTVTVSAVVTNADGTTATGTLTITLASAFGDVTDVTIVPGTPS